MCKGWFDGRPLPACPDDPEVLLQAQGGQERGADDDDDDHDDVGDDDDDDDDDDGHDICRGGDPVLGSYQSSAPPSLAQQR